jgi:hypothetical protein
LNVYNCCGQATEKMRTTLKISILIFGLLGQSCSKPDSRFEDLLKSPEKYHGQWVDIKGIMHKRSEDKAIYLTASSPATEAIWIEYTKLEMTVEDFDNLDGKKVRVRGTFDKEDKGRLGQYAGSLKKMVIMEIAE